MTVAYVLNTYPQPSHSFIRREVRALEASGTPVLRLAMRRPTMPLVDPQDHEEEAKTHYVLEHGALALGGAMLSRLVKAPGAWRRGFCQALRAGARHPLGRLRHLIYFAEGCYIANRCGKARVTHIHSHFGTNSATVAMLAHTVGGPGYSFTVHGPEEFDAPHALSLGDKMANAAFTVAISSFGRSQLCRWVDQAHWPRLKVVHCGIDPGKFPAPVPVTPGAPRLVSIGRFSEQKGQLVLVEAMAQIVAQHPDAHLVLVGDGEMRPELEAAIKSHGLEGNITLTGWLSEDAVRAELARAQALVMPSFAEGLPMVIMEAMAAGRPVIATYIAGIPELVQPGRTGWLVPAGDAGALAQAVDELAQCDAATLTQMGKAGRARALERHDVGKEAAKLADHFKQAEA
ncbi:glycosyltransferase family 4 protein [Roseovarius sp. MMSF_3281]|uniref:glycosyltransferase family 4 protein n=1 Tax=Roseovarius sp. MMSF_3281 TaxID=3046694 RepID=UPI00273D1A98|nr:glycosyltransferase family 4 protein [Roseovarius sp. MMSF_3281]